MRTLCGARAFLFTLLVILGGPGFIINTTDAAPAIPGFDRFHAASKDAAGGRLLLGELNCVACHKAEGAVAEQIEANPAPSLKDVGNRLNPEWVAAFVKNPHGTKPGTRMPGPPSSVPQKLVDEHTEVLTHYLMSLTAGAPPRITGKVGNGVNIFNNVGCAACHAPLGNEASVKSDKATVPLPDVKAKYASSSALAAFLLDPHKWRAGGRMPKLNLTNDEALSIASAFGLGAVTVRQTIRPSDDAALAKAGIAAALIPGVRFELYEGQLDKLPNFDALKAAETGTMPKFTPGKASGKDNMALRMRGYIAIPTDGVYNFASRSDDGSRVTIGNDMVVNNDGVHAPTEQAGSIELKKGLHAITVEYFEGGGGEELHVSISGPGLNRQEIKPQMLSHHKDGMFIIGEEKKVTANGDTFVMDPEKAKAGKAVFAMVGCVACHQIDGVKAGDLALAPKPLAQLKGSKGKGCLSENPGGFSQNFSLSAAQIDAIAAALETIDSAPVLTAAQKVDHTLTSLNCYACHARGDKGGPEDGHKASFTGTYEDLADEGRLPPHLGDVGAKLTKPWLTEILTKGTKVRPYMNTRMPVFGNAVMHLVEDFAKTETLASSAKVPEVSQKDAMKHGRALVGTGGMACVQCHVFAGEKSLGLPAMDLALMTQRLQRDWFGRYLLNPAQLRPGTRMPQFWPEGKSVRADILDGDTALQIENIWQYLSRGGKGPLPPGLARAAMLLSHDTEAVMYRNFIQGAGPRAIGVGYPEKVNIAWDANTLRPAMIWQGEFIDASKHWTDRGSGFQSPAGYSVINLPEGPPIALLDSESAAWPAPLKANNVTRAAGMDFKGYSLDKLRRPTFMYVMNQGGASAKDFYEGVAAKNDNDDATLKRTLTIEAKSAENLYVRLAAGSIENVEGGYRIDKTLVIKVTSDAKAIVRAAGNSQELIVPVKLTNGKATIIAEYVW